MKTAIKRIQRWLARKYVMRKLRRMGYPEGPDADRLIEVLLCECTTVVDGHCTTCGAEVLR